MATVTARVTFAAGVRRVGATLIGGTPLRVLRLRDAGQEQLDRALAGETVDSESGRRLITRLLDGGQLVAEHTPARAPHANVTVVLPVRGPAPHLQRLIDVIGRAEPGRIVVVDDGSTVPLSVHGAEVIRHVASRGPGAARNTGWRAASTELIAFLDADVMPTGHWLDDLIGQMADPAVVAVAPRVISTPTASTLGRYERHRSALDMGRRPGVVRTGGPLPYVPSAALLVRRSELDAVDGFDEQLRYGEDVDLIWRLNDRPGRTVYHPAVEVEHVPRSSWTEWFGQRHAYGTSASALARRHGGAVAPFASDPWFAVAAVAASTRRAAPLGFAALAVQHHRLRRRLADQVDRPGVEATRLSLLGLRHGTAMTASAVRRSWLPLAVAASIVNRRARRLLSAVMIGPPLLSWIAERPDIDPARWTVLCGVDDAAYCSGVWAGAWRDRSIAAVKPVIS